MTLEGKKNLETLYGDRSHGALSVSAWPNSHRWLISVSSSSVSSDATSESDWRHATGKKDLDWRCTPTRKKEERWRS
jgi:hypothetical protein